MQVSWELSSPYLGSMLHKLLPRDTYTLFKSGARVRIDGHLKGMKENSGTFLPELKYGSFSIIVDTSQGGSMKPIYVSHDKKCYTILEVCWNPFETSVALDHVHSWYFRSDKSHHRSLAMCGLHYMRLCCVGLAWPKYNGARPQTYRRSHPVVSTVHSSNVCVILHVHYGSLAKYWTALDCNLWGNRLGSHCNFQVFVPRNSDPSG
jgi:hypothetical protein